MNRKSSFLWTAVVCLMFSGCAYCTGTCECKTPSNTTYDKECSGLFFGFGDAITPAIDPCASQDEFVTIKDAECIGVDPATGKTTRINCNKKAFTLQPVADPQPNGDQ